MTHAVEFMMNQLMLVQRQHFLGVESYERSDERDGYANGFKSRKVKTGTGQFNLEKSNLLLNNFGQKVSVQPQFRI